MPSQGEVYSLNHILPPGQPNWHRLVVLSSNNAISSHGVQFLLIAIIRSSTKDGKAVRRVIGHSILLPGGTISTLPNEGLIETHQLFHVNIKAFHGQSADGRLAKGLLEN